MCLLTIMLIHDELLLSSQPPLSGHLPVPRERPINGGSTVEVSPDFAFLYDYNQKSFQTVLD